MVVGQVDRAGAEPDPPGLAQQPGDEDQRGRDVLRRIGEVLADETFAEAQLLGEQHQLPVLLERDGQFPPRRMDGHGEKAELHEPFSVRSSAPPRAILQVVPARRRGRG
jgi:hypothetical protein